MTDSDAKKHHAYYDMLGISESADSEEIKAAYEKLLCQYQPEKFASQDLKEDAMLIRKRAQKAYDYAMCRLEVREQDLASQFDKIRILINENKLEKAELYLDVIDETDRLGEWYFLYGCLMSQKGWFIEANTAFETASTYEPSNTEYNEASEAMKKTVSEYKHGYRQSSKAHNFEHCFDNDFFTDCFCACCCEGCMECCCEWLCEGLGNCG